MDPLPPPDEDWYTRQSARRNLPQHCPLAANDKCPRYFLSQSYVAKVGAASLNLGDETASALAAKWAASDVFTSDELSVGTWHNHDGALRGVDGFCPEVTARVLGLYSTSLRDYPDDDARAKYHQLLKKDNAPKEDPRWQWMVVAPRHYTACHEFSVYGGSEGSSGSKSKNRKGTLSPRLRFLVFSRDGYRCIYCGITGKDSALQIDHKISVADGGTDDISNLVTACEKCNAGKGARSVADG